MAEIVSKAIETHYTINISKSSETKQYSPRDHVRHFLFLDVPLELREKQNEETERTQRAIAALANSVTATARKTPQLKTMLQTSLRQTELCYRGSNEHSDIQDIIMQATGIVKRNATKKTEILYPTPSNYDRIEV